jgi:hypothetical protein
LTGRCPGLDAGRAILLHRRRPPRPRALDRAGVDEAAARRLGGHERGMAERALDRFDEP